MRRACLFVLVCVSLVVTGSKSGGQTEQPKFDPVGLQSKRGYFAQLPFESVDMVNGNLILTFTDLVLPGNAGMDLRIVRSYNHQAIGFKWSFGFAGVPLWIEQPEHLSLELPWEPAAVTADGNRHRLYGSPTSEYLYTSSFWRYHRATRTLELPNGWVATYETLSGLGVAMLNEVRDPFGNALEPDWEGGEPADLRPLRLLGVTQTSYGIGADWSRTVTFTYPTGHFSRMPETMTYDGRIWTYTEGVCCVPGTEQRLLTSVDAPGDVGGNWAIRLRLQRS